MISALRAWKTGDARMPCRHEREPLDGARPWAQDAVRRARQTAPGRELTKRNAMTGELRARGLSAAVILTAGLALTGPAPAQAPRIGDPPQASNMRLVGFNDLQARSAYQPIISR